MIDAGLGVLFSLGFSMALFILVVLISRKFKKNACQQRMTEVCGDLPGQVSQFRKVLKGSSATALCLIYNSYIFPC